MSGKLVNVEAGRGIASVLVVLYHANLFYFATPKYWSGEALGGAFAFGRAGVEFFFVLSGYIMMVVHRRDLGQPAKIGPFLQKRFVRIYPFFWLVLAVTVALYALNPGSGQAMYRDPLNILQSALLAGREPLHAVVFVSWSMWHEILFYGLFAVMIGAPRIGVPLFALWIAACAVIGWGGVPTPWPNYFTRFVNVLFALGVLSALALERFRIPAARWLLAAGALIFLGAGVDVDLSHDAHESLSNALFGLGSAMALLGAVEAERGGRLKAPGWLVLLGGASYAIYLTHMLTLPILAKLARRFGLVDTLPPWAGFVALTAAAVLAGVAVHLAVERPIVEGARRLFGGAPRRMPAGAAADNSPS